MRLDDYLRHMEAVEKRLTDPARRKLHIQYVGKSAHGGINVTVFVMGTWFHHIHINQEALETPDLFAYVIESSLRVAVGVLLEEAVKMESKALREDLDKGIEERAKEESENVAQSSQS